MTSSDEPQAQGAEAGPKTRATAEEIASAEAFLKEQSRRRESAWFEMWGGAYGLVCGLIFLAIASWSTPWALRFFFAAAIVGLVAWVVMRIRTIIAERRGPSAAPIAGGMTGEAKE